MHGYPIYARWSDGATDDLLLPFLARVTHWLGHGGDVLFSEFGLPTYRGADFSEQRAQSAVAPTLIEENAAAAYTATALEELRRAGCLGAMLWCYSDYDRALWENPPLDLATHERTFGLWRVDGSPKPSVSAVAGFVGAERCAAGHAAAAWIDIEPSEFFRDPSAQLPRLFRRYRSSRESDGGTRP